MKISSFAEFVNEMKKIDSTQSMILEVYNYKNIELNSITYKDIYNHIHDRMWRIAKEIVYGKGYQGDPLNNSVVIKYGNEEINAPELFYVLWTNIDQYTSTTNITRDDLEGRMEHVSDGASRDYKNSAWYQQMYTEEGINAGFNAHGYLGDFIAKVALVLNKYFDSNITLNKDLKKFNLENPKNVRKLARAGELRNVLAKQSEIPDTMNMLSYINGKEECIKAYIKQTSEGVLENPAFGMEDYADALSSCKGFMEMKMNRPETTVNTIGWNILYYMNEFIYEFVLHYFSEDFSKSIKGYN